MALKHDALVLSTREAGNDSFNYNLIFGYVPKGEDIRLLGVLLNASRYQCGQTYTSTYLVESPVELQQSLSRFDGTRAFHQLKAAYPQLQAASDATKLLPVALEQAAAEALATYRKGDMAGLKRQLDALGIVEGETHCDLDRYVVERFFHVGRLGWSNDMAFLFAEAGRLRQALILLQWVVRADPQRTVAHLNLADTYWGLGDTEQARQYYLRYRELMVADGKATRIPPRVAERGGR
jgi:tetratricopeptide (TPR) repeat protein